MRQDYRKAVTVICDNWDILKNLWGGSPTRVSISNSTSSFNESDDFDLEKKIDEQV